MSHKLVKKPSSFIRPIPKSTISSAPHFQPVQQKATPDSVVQKKSSPKQQIASERQMWDNMRSGLQVQAKCAKCGEEEANHSPSQIAATGFTGSPVPLPHLDKIQRSFGQDLSHVQAYIGGSAATASKRLGAQAYTMGNKIAFQKPPSVELSAHEGTHVVQQQSGKVQLAGEIGKVGDKYEVEADAVGTKVAAGQSVAPLLSKYSSNPVSQTSQVQKRELTNQEQDSMNCLERFANEAAKEDEEYSGKEFADRVKSAKGSILNDIGAVGAGAEDSLRLMTTLWTLHIWTTEPKSYGQAELLPNSGENVREVDVNKYKCNRFVGDAYAIGTGRGYDRSGKGGTYPTMGKNRSIPGYPVSANLLASDKQDGVLEKLPTLPESWARAGDIVSFDLSLDDSRSDHTGIYLGSGVYISARNEEERPVPDMQKKDGVQITNLHPSPKKYRRFAPYINSYKKYMEVGNQEGESGFKLYTLSKAYAHFSNAIDNFKKALIVLPGDKNATEKLGEFTLYRDIIRQEYDRYMREGWAAIERGIPSENSQEKKKGEYNSALINFRKAYNRISTGELGRRAVREINKVTDFINSL